MCGIAAIFGKQQAAALIHDIRRMTDLVRHRGPDDEGFVLLNSDSACQIYGGPNTPPEVVHAPYPFAPKENIPNTLTGEALAALGHRRLSIVDLSPAGHQPMCTPDRRYWITYNGEIYNHVELRRELESMGYPFLTHSDTEVILHAYQEWGRDCFHMFNGMFAIVIYDCFKQKVIAARDRFGVKPLYFWSSTQGFIAFASEIKQFTVLSGWKARIHGQNAYDFLNWGALDHGPETMFSGVMQLRGGELLEFTLNVNPLKLQPKTWYHLIPQRFKGSFEEAAAGYRDILTDAIRLRLRADVEVGSCLSGGLDSSSLVCVAHELLTEKKATEKQRTFSACSDVKRFDESHFIDIVVNKTGVNAQYTTPDHERLFEDLSNIIWHQDEPFGSTSIYAQWLVFQCAKQAGVKVMLDGQGADEQLAGYHGFYGNRFYDLLMSMRWKTLLEEMRTSRGMHPAIQPGGMLLNKLLPDFIRQPLRKILNKSSKNPGWLNANRLGAHPIDPFLKDPNRSVYNQSLLQISRSSLPMLLHFEDRDSMAHSVESRTPFLDYRLVEYTLGLPSDYKLSNGITKRVLREGMKGILPEEIRSRRDKLGFATAEEDWVRKRAPDLFHQYIDETIQLSQGILLPSAKSIAAEMIEGKVPFDFFLWRLICFGQWIKRFDIQLPS